MSEQEFQELHERMSKVSEKDHPRAGDPPLPPFEAIIWHVGEAAIGGEISHEHLTNIIAEHDVDVLDAIVAELERKGIRVTN